MVYFMLNFKYTAITFLIEYLVPNLSHFNIFIINCYFNYKINLDRLIINFIKTYFIASFFNHILTAFLAAYLFNLYFSYTFLFRVIN